jgi:hypothetical protein
MDINHLSFITGSYPSLFTEAAKELLAQGVQKPSCRVGEKRFLGGLFAASAAMVKRPAGLRTGPA